MISSDVAIVGAGPAGSLAAWEIMHKNPDISVSVFEEHKEIGRPPHCSGLFSLKGFCNLGLNPQEITRELGYNPIVKAKIVSPNNNTVEIYRGSDSMGVFDRIAVDRYFAQRAQSAGCNYFLRHRVQRIKFDGSLWKIGVKTSEGTVTFGSKILILAEGVRARLTRSVGLKPPNPRWVFSAVQYEFERVLDLDSDAVELYFGRAYAPGFFAWLIPIREGEARLGVATAPWAKGYTRAHMKYFLKKHPSIHPRLKKGKIKKTYGGMVSATGPIKKTYSSGLMIVGDAAGQVKATTGGGVNIGGYSGLLAGLMAKKIVTGEISLDHGCREYQKRWQAHFEPELTLMKLLRRTMTPLSDKSWDQIIEIAGKTDLENSLRTTNIDLHGGGLLKYAFTPRVLIKGVDLIPRTVASLLAGLTM
ncbi:MAG: geranylgeranyl reductase family protein [Candidatus Heimdallarchaeota archaeon]